MVISSLVVEAIGGDPNAVSEALNALDGVEVHHIEEYKIVVTIEAESVEASHEMANSFLDIDGVTNVNLVYVNFEDDPHLKELWEKRYGAEGQKHD